MNWKNHVLSATKDEKGIIEAIIKLHNNGRQFDLDPCYSVGRFWKGLPKPVLKFDIKPQADGCVQASATSLPLASNSISSIMFDPPFVTRSHPRNSGKIAARFSCFETVEDLWGFYSHSLQEFYRILKPNGIVAFKCQDLNYGGNQWMSHYEIMKYAEKVGYYFQDIFVLVRDNVMFSPGMANQRNARKNHCYFLILRKINNISLVGRNSQVPLHSLRS